MTWWAWLLLWTLLVLGAGVVLFLLGRDLWRKTRAVAGELHALTDRLDTLGDRLADLDAAREGVGDRPSGVGSSRPGPRDTR